MHVVVRLSSTMMPTTTMMARSSTTATATMAHMLWRHTYTRRRPRSCCFGMSATGIGAWRSFGSSFVVQPSSLPLSLSISSPTCLPWTTNGGHFRKTFATSSSSKKRKNRGSKKLSKGQLTAENKNETLSPDSSSKNRRSKRRRTKPNDDNNVSSSSETTNAKNVIKVQEQQQKQSLNGNNKQSTTTKTEKNTARIEHEQKVAAVQARILLRRQKESPQQNASHQNQAAPVAAAATPTVSRDHTDIYPSPSRTSIVESQSIRPPESSATDGTKAASTSCTGNIITPEELNIVLNSINHWLSKDPGFFDATMKAMDLKLLQDPNNNKIGGAVKNAHPIQAFWNEYRQLYNDSIPEFRDELERLLTVSTTGSGKAEDQRVVEQGDTRSLSLRQSIHDLKQAGFGDPVWSRRFRQVRGYRLQREGLSTHLAKQQTEIQLRQAELQQERFHLDHMIDFLNDLRDRSEAISVDSTIDRPHSKGKPNSPHERIEGQEDNSSYEKQSFLQKVIDTVSWIWAPVTPTASGSVPEKKQEKNNAQERKQNASNARKKERFTKESNRLQKRIERKQVTIQRLEDIVDEATSKLDDAMRTMDKLQSPMSEDEHKVGQDVLSKIRDPICSAFAQYISKRHAQSIRQYQALESKTDLTKPHEWYGYARLDRRKIIFHGGPTNSGKTYNALQRLKEAKCGLYLGPLRLLAAEIYETLTTDGVYTNLYTGQERREVAFSTVTACTVEMAGFEKEYDIAVIDEIQMITDTTRGAAWTRALLGLRCKEIHVCGGLEAMDIVEKLARQCDDEFEVKEYKRFSKLAVSKKSLTNKPRKKGAYSNVEPGDCVVAFSRNDIFAIKREIESTTNYKCSVVYGQLPPAVRHEQSRRFNDPNSGYDILVASDAIGMGLNLNIQRVIFNSIFKFNGDKIVRLSHSEIKQISGRAGRKNSPYPNGEVSCRDPRDLRYIQDCLNTDIEPISKAAILPTAAHIEQFHDAIQAYQVEDQDAVGLHRLLEQFGSMATVKGDFFLGRQMELQMIAKSIKDVPLTLKDAYTFCLSPTSGNSLGLLENFAWKYSRSETSGIPSRPVPKPAKSFDDLSHLCSIYTDADLFLWLQWKFPPSNAMEQAAAMSRKEKTLEHINEALSQTDKLKLSHSYIDQATRHRATWESFNGPSEKIGPNFELRDDVDDDQGFDGDNNDYDGQSDDEEDDDDDEQTQIAFN
jgi:ATP-dependent RNA helicase SUPV3L1/SUV3